MNASMSVAKAFVPLVFATAMMLGGCGQEQDSKLVSIEENAITVEDQMTLTQRTYSVVKDAEITRNGEPAELDDLQVGDSLKVTTRNEDDGETVATAIEAESVNDSTEEAEPTPGQPLDTPSEQPLLPGSDFDENDPVVPPEFDDADPALPAKPEQDGEPEADESQLSINGKVTASTEKEFAVEDEAGNQHVFTVTDETRITNNGREIKLDEVATDDAVTVTARDEDGQLVAVSIELTSQPAVPDVPEADQPSDPQENELDILPQFDDADPADQDESNLDAEREKEVSTTPVEGTVIAPEMDQFAIEDGEGEQHIFVVMDDTRITHDGKEINFDEIALGDSVKVMARDDAGMLVAFAIELKKKPTNPSDPDEEKPTVPDVEQPLETDEQQ